MIDSRMFSNLTNSYSLMIEHSTPELFNRMRKNLIEKLIEQNELFNRLQNGQCNGMVKCLHIVPYRQHQYSDTTVFLVEVENVYIYFSEGILIVNHYTDCISKGHIPCAGDRSRIQFLTSLLYNTELRTICGIETGNNDNTSSDDNINNVGSNFHKKLSFLILQLILKYHQFF